MMNAAPGLDIQNLTTKLLKNWVKVGTGLTGQII
jgi:hypothetical protein